MSELLDAIDFKKVKENIILCKDGKEEWKFDFVEYINDDCDQSDLSFFYDSLPFIRFIVSAKQDNVAYTKPNKKIYMNAPNITDIGESKVLWESIYFHECLHQLWDTFGVGEQIKKELGADKYNHVLLNIASDCVINEFIMNNMGRKMPKNLIDADAIKSQFGVDYDRNKDTQFSLYEKLLPIAEKKQKELEEFLKQHPELLEDGDGDDDGQDGNPGGPGGDPDPNGKSGKGNSKGNAKGNEKDPIDDMTADEAADDAQKSADAAKEAAEKAAQKAKESGEEKDAEAAAEAAEAAEKAQQSADKAKAEAENGNENGARKAAKEARDKANQAKNKEKGQNGKESGREVGDHSSQGKGTGTKQIADSDGPHTLEEFINEDMWDEESNKMAEENLQNHKNRLSGAAGEFVSKIKQSIKEISQSRDGKGFKTFAQQASSDWDVDFKKIVDVYITSQVNKKRREMEPTYSRPNRRAGYVEYGKPIKKGQKIRENKLNISMSFYIDKSGSMAGEDLENATALAYGLSDAIEGKHKHETKYIEKFDFKFYTFNEHVQKIKKGERVQDEGGNMSFEELLNVIKTHSMDDMINVIITDAGFSANVSATTKFIDNMGGLFVFVTNTDQCINDYKEVEKRVEKKNFKHILADQHFDLHEKTDKI